MQDNDIFRYVREDRERVLATYTDTSADIRHAGLFDFFVPSTLAGVFLCLLSLVMWGVFSFSPSACGALAALGMMLLATGVVFLCIFRRRASLAAGVELYITTRSLVYISAGEYMRLPLCEISSVSLESECERRVAPFDMLSCEGARIRVVYRDSVVYLPYVRDAGSAVLVASALLDNKGELC